MRQEVRRSVVERKRRATVRLGDRLSLVFESRHTLRAAVEESLRAGNASPDQVGAELDAFNGLLPQGGGLLAVLYIDAADPAELAHAAEELADIATEVYLEIDRVRVRATIQPEAAPGAWRLVFPLSPTQREAWATARACAAGVDHPALTVRSELSAEQREAIGDDL